MTSVLNISHGNIKTGAIPSFSLPSGKTCSPTACSTCFLDGCYAKKIERLRPNVNRAYENNYAQTMQHSDDAEKWLKWYFSNPNAPRYFRIHVSGDFYSCEYFEMWLRVIKESPRTKFLAFTKQINSICSFLVEIPDNLSLIWSAWPNVEIPKEAACSMRIAWMQDGTETRIPENALLCPGNCETCTKCWDKAGTDIVFHKH